MAKRVKYKTNPNGTTGYGGFVKDSSRSGVLIRSPEHEFVTWLRDFLKNLNIAQFVQLGHDALDGTNDEAVVSKMFDNPIEPDEQRGAYARATSLSSLPPGLLADRAAVTPFDEKRFAPRQFASLQLQIVSRLDRASAVSGSTRPSSEGAFEVFDLGKDKDGRRIDIESHASDLLALRRENSAIFALVIEGDIENAMGKALALGSGPSRDKAVQCVAVQSVVCAAEHSQRAHAYIVALKRESVPKPLRKDISAADLRAGGVVFLDKTQRELAAKYLKKFDAKVAFDKKSDFPGHKAPLEAMLRKLVLEIYGPKTDLEDWNTAIKVVIRNILKSLAEGSSEGKTIDSESFLLTQWFGWTERELLLAINMQALRAREIAKAIIAAPNLPADTDVAALLYPPTLGRRSDTNADAAYRICIQMTALAEKSAYPTPTNAKGNAEVREAAFDLLGKLDALRRAGGKPSTRAERFFDAFNPLQRPGRQGR